MLRLVTGIGWLVAMVITTTPMAQDKPLAESELVYREQCGACHGMMTSKTPKQSQAPSFEAVIQVVMTSPAGPSLTASDTANWTMPVSRQPATATWGTPGERVAVALPYGPPLRGVYGRPAGSVEDFEYSKAFRKTLQGKVWNRHRLDAWLTDSQALAPGSRMFYEQADAEIRRIIIAYLKARR